MAGPGKPGPKGLDPSNPFSEGRHYDVDLETGCWNWRLFKRRGYGIHKSQQAHRVQYAALVGPIPAGYDVHHVCENKACVNPEHLMPKPRIRHRADHRRGESCMTPETIVELRERAAAGIPLAVLSREYGLSHRNVRDIVNGVTWRDIGGPIGQLVRVCGWCGGELTGGFRHRRYCDPACRNAAGHAREKARRHV